MGSGFRLQKINTPAAPTVTPQGVTGGSTYIYYIVAEDFRGNKTLVSNSTTINNGNSSLNVSNFNRITWPKIPGAYKYYILKNSITSVLATITDPYISSAFPNSTYDDIGGSTSVFSQPTRNATGDAIIDGQLALGEDPINALSAATKQYVDSRTFSTGVRTCFFQSAAPSGWTQDTNVNDRVIRISSGAGNVQGGSWTISGFTAAGHTHTVPIDGYSTTGGSLGAVVAGRMVTGSGLNENAEALESLRSAGSAQQSGNSGTLTVTNDGTWRPAYIDAIICVKS
jgi:hypothetical protein